MSAVFFTIGRNGQTVADNAGGIIPPPVTLEAQPVLVTDKGGYLMNTAVAGQQQYVIVSPGQRAMDADSRYKRCGGFYNS